MADTQMPDINDSATNNETSQLYNDRRSAQSGRTEMQVLESIERQLGQILQNGGNINNISASNANNRYGRNGSTYYQDRSSLRRSGRSGSYRDFTQAFERELMDGLFGNEFRTALSEMRKQLAKDLGVELGEIPKELGKLAGRHISDIFKNSDFGKRILEPFNEWKSQLGQRMQDAYARGSAPYRQAGDHAFDRRQWSGTAQMDDLFSEVGRATGNSVNSTISETLERTIGQGDLGSTISSIAGMGENASGVETALGGLRGVIGEINPEVLAAGAATAGAFIALDVAVDAVTTYIKNAVKPTLEAFKKTMESVAKAMERYESSRQEKIDDSMKRLQADIDTMVKTPFKILEDAAQRWYDTWDNNLRMISATQGYNKENVYTLYGSYVDRLQSEGLEQVIGATDIVNNLSNVLASGLQGAAAEEFAYIATKLNAAIPTQDFFNYTEGYITAVSNAMSQGKTQAEAIAIANEELETFANSLLYAGRELSGGFTVGLKGAENLFQKAEQIAQAGKYGSGAQLGTTLSSIASITGAIAPDLVSSIVDVVYNAAVGGNASELVALRSLAGINASNTEFLNALITDPQTVFGEIFDKLYQYQNMANGAYMEVAEGLSSIFGVSTEALARIDFGQVSSAVKASASPSSALNQSMKLLASGQTTTNAELLRMNQISKYIAEEGLQYVLDDEAGRAVLQHEWDEQIAQELMETTYGVELTGNGLNTLNSIANTVNKLLQLNPVDMTIGKIKKVAIAEVTSAQTTLWQNDIKQMLELAKVGQGNLTELAQLTTYGQKQNLIGSMTELLGGTSSYKASQEIISRIESSLGGMGGYEHDEILSGISDRLRSETASIKAAQSALTAENAVRAFAGDFSGVVNSAFDGYMDSWTEANSERLYHSGGGHSRGEAGTTQTLPIVPVGALSQYTWGMIGKSLVNRAYSNTIPTYTSGSTVSEVTVANEVQQQSRLTANLQKMVDSMETFYEADNNRTYEDFVKTAKSYGIADYEKALEDRGLTELDIRSMYENMQTETASKAELARRNKEEDYWENNILQLTTTNTWLESINSTATSVLNLFDEFVNAWKDYFIEHTVYNSAYTRDAVQKVLNEERDSSETAIYALADALTQNDVKLLLDPTVQTNALLAQILKVANAILIQQGDSGSISLPDTLAGLSLGIINQ